MFLHHMQRSAFATALALSASFTLCAKEHPITSNVSAAQVFLNGDQAPAVVSVEALAQAGIFLDVLDDRSEWYTYHTLFGDCLLYTSPSPRDRTRYRMPSSA